MTDRYKQSSLLRFGTNWAMYKVICQKPSGFVYKQVIAQPYFNNLAVQTRNLKTTWGHTIALRLLPKFQMLVVSQRHISQLQKDVSICIEHNFFIYYNCQPFGSWDTGRWDMTSVNKFYLTSQNYKLYRSSFCETKQKHAFCKKLFSTIF